MRKTLLSKFWLLLLCTIVGVNSAWAAEGDTHDFTQSLQQLLNNNASISSIDIAEQQYYVKKVIVRYRYNKTITNAVTIAVSVGGNNWGSQNVVGTDKDYTTMDFSGDAVKGAISISFTNNTGTGTGHGTLYVDNVQLVEGAAAVSGTTAAPNISGSTSFLNNTTVTITNAPSASGADIYYTLNGEDPTTTTSSTCFAYSSPFTINETTTVKAISKKSTDTNASSVVEETFTKITPLSVAEAISATPSSGTSENKYIHGIVSAFYDKSTSIMGDGSNYRYYISDDGTTTNQLLVYKGKKSSTEDFSNANDLIVGDEITIYGGLTTFNSTKEVASGNYIVNLTRKPAPTFTLDLTETTLESYTHETAEVNLTTNTDGEITCESSNPDVATVTLKSAGVYTITAQMEGTATITIKSASSGNFRTAQATVAVTVSDTRENSGLNYAQTSISKTWGETFTGQELTNPNSVAVTYSSTDESVATVNASGEVSVLKAGSTTIKASFAGNSTYKNMIASYELTINKANAGIAYAVTSYDIMLNDDSFEAPTLINPNGLTVTYASNNTSVADVNGDTGELFYYDNAEGTAKITATFAGNDNYKNGSASYTITIVDPTVKGCKYNPYTVSEVRAISTSKTINDVYVEGYIIGYVNSTYGFTTNSSLFANSNWAIADSKDETDVDKTAPVQISSSNQSIYGLSNHKDLIGSKILIKGDITKYFNVSGVKNLDEIKAMKDITISAAKYATYCSTNKLDFSAVEGLSAYTASVTSNVVTFNPVTKAVPDKTGLLLKSNAAGTFYVPIATSADAITSNVLEGVTADTEKAAGIFVLMNGAKGVGFYKTTKAFTVGANTAYLPAEVAASRMFIGFNDEDEVTGINASLNEKGIMTNDQFIYNLRGMRVTTPKKGLYIKGGKKLFVK